MNRAIVRDPLVTADAIDEPVLVALLNALPGVHVQQADQNEPLLTTPSPNDRWSVPFAIDYSTAGLRTLEFLRWCCKTACPLHWGPCALELAAHLPDPDHQVAWALRESGIQAPYCQGPA